jgi:hypothetical protein
LHRAATLVSRFCHGGLSQPHLNFAERQLSAALAAPRPSRGQARFCALSNQFALEFGEGRENPEHQFTAGRGRIDVGALASKDLQADTSARQVVDRVDQVTQVAPQAVELPNH